jgi:aryl sulfotransferase
MPKPSTAWPLKTRELHNHHIDSTRWNDFKFRDDDIVIGTWAKSGTTWMQQIIGQLIFDGAEDVPVIDLCPWVDIRFLPYDEMIAALEAQTHRRFLKTHLPVDALVLSPRAKYIFIGRDGRDTVWSLYNHHAGFSEQFYEMMGSVPGIVGPMLEPPSTGIVEYFNAWLDGDGYPFWPFWSHTRSWWDVRDLPNVLLVHFNALKHDMPGEMRRVADFLEIEVAPQRWPTLIEHCTFDYMKKNASKLSGMLDEVFRGGGATFIHRGTNDRWRNLLSQADIDKYEAAARSHLGADCARWLESGELRAGA